MTTATPFRQKTIQPKKVSARTRHVVWYLLVDRTGQPVLDEDREPCLWSSYEKAKRVLQAGESIVKLKGKYLLQPEVAR